MAEPSGARPVRQRTSKAKSALLHGTLYVTIHEARALPGDPTRVSVRTHMAVQFGRALELLFATCCCRIPLTAWSFVRTVRPGLYQQCARGRREGCHWTHEAAASVLRHVGRWCPECIHKRRITQLRAAMERELPSVRRQPRCGSAVHSEGMVLLALIVQLDMLLAWVLRVLCSESGVGGWKVQALNFQSMRATSYGKQGLKSPAKLKLDPQVQLLFRKGYMNAVSAPFNCAGIYFWSSTRHI
jgi:hypothetical protein